MERPDQPPSKRKRRQSRSRSITPPPALSIQSLQNARNLVRYDIHYTVVLDILISSPVLPDDRQTLDQARRPVSPTLIADDSTDTIVLDPELVQIAQEVRTQASQKSFTSEISGGPEHVTIKVNWRPHPLNEAGRTSIWGFKMKRVCHPESPPITCLA
jgi:hypothetical protein